MSDFSQRLQSLSPEKKALLARELKKKGHQFNFFPLSFAQQRLWLLDQLDPGNPSYNISTALRFAGRLHVAALERSLRIVVQRHESLRATFVTVQGQPVQRVTSSARVALPLIDLSGLSVSSREPEMQRHADKESLHAFHLAQGPLLRFKLFRLSETEHVAVLNIHHIVSDGWSTTVLLRELASNYSAILQGQPSSLPPLPIQYADYAAWQRNWLQGPVLAEHLSYWRQRLDNEKPLPGVLDLPTDRSRPVVQTYRGNLESLTLSPSLSQQLRDLSRKEGVTLFMTLLAIFQLLLYRYTGQEDLVVGAPIANRNRAETEGLIGFFINSLVLRTDLSGNPSFRELLMRVREVALGAYAHQDLPFDKLVEELSPERNLSHTPLFQVYFNMINLPSQPTTWAELNVSIFAPREAGAKFDLTLYVTDSDNGILLQLLYNTDLFDQSRMLAMLHQYAHLASQVLNVEQEIACYSLVAPAEQTVLPDPTAPLSDRWLGSVQSLFAQQARHIPEHVAIIDPTASMTYQELDELSNRLAHYLLASGLQRGDVVAVYAYRSLPLVLAVFGVLKAGAACLILDPAYPPARLIEYLTAVNLRAWLHIQAPDPADSKTSPLPTDLQVFLSTSACRCQLVLPQRLSALREILAPYSPSASNVEVGPDDLAFVTFTSGSTGQPKGILQRHGPLSHFLPWQQQRFGLQQADHYSMLSGLAHDPLQREMFTPLCLGGTICIPPTASIGAPGSLAAWMQRQAINIAHLTPALLQLLTQSASGSSPSTITLPALRCAFTVGDALTRRDVNRLYSMAPSLTCVNFYGSTETQRAIGYFVIPRTASFDPQNTHTPQRAKEIIPLGQGIQDTQLLILNHAQQLAAITELGELYVRSPHLAAGYLNDPTLTQQRFITNPFTGLDSDRLYRTGDLARYRPDGNVEFAGRNDQQVKLRGFRIELAEIEAVLGLHPAVREAVVIAREDTPEQKRLVAYVVLAQAPSPASLAHQLRDFLAARLPTYMLPSAFVSLDALPFTPNRKVDRRALPIPETVMSTPEPVVAPRTPTEELLVGIWSRMLARQQLSVDDNFFDLGGHSLLATQLLARINEAFHLEIPLRALFVAPTVARLAAYLDRHRAAAKTTTHQPQAIIQLPRPYQSASSSAQPAPSSLDSSMPPNASYRFPLSFSQERLWFLDQLEPGNPAYIILVQLRIHGKLLIRALQHSIHALVQRHETLRTTLVTIQGRPQQVIASSLDIPLAMLDLSALPAPERQAHIQLRLQDEAQRAFDLARGPLFSLTLLRLSPQEHLFLLSIHHAIFDAWSIDVFFRELNILYTTFLQGQPSALPPLPIQYADYSVWQRQSLQGDTLARLLAYWKAQLANAPAALELPLDRPRPPLQTYRGARSPLNLPALLTRALLQLSRQLDVTLFMTLLAAFQTLLFRYTGQPDILVGAPIAGRSSVAVERLIGLFINTLVMRGDLTGDPRFSDLLKRVREVALDAYAHQHIPFEKLVEELQPQRNVSYSPLFQVMCILQNTPTHALHLADLAITSLAATRVTAQYDLTLVLWQEDARLQGYLEYNTDLFEPPTIERLSGHFHTLLAGIVTRPDQRISQLPLLTTTERQQMLNAWNATQANYPLDHTIHTLFAQQAQRVPDSIAVISGASCLTYCELNRRANLLARYLRSRAIGRGSLVALCLDRSPRLLIGLLAILKSGAAYVPLDPSYPQERLAFMLADSQAALILTQQRLLDTLPALATGAPAVLLDSHWCEIARQPDNNPPDLVSGADLAYVIYTSGSTGQPKGVQIPHRALLNFLFAMLAQPGLHARDTLLAVTSLSFDIAGLELYLPLLVGARILLASQETARDAQLLAQLLVAGAPTVMQATPATWRLLLEVGWQGHPHLSILCGGEALPPDLARQLRATGASLWNLYGPTETTIWSLSQPVEAVERAVPIGRPLANTQVYVLDPRWQPVPVGIRGDLYIGGDGLARGYLNRPDLTAERFLPDPFSAQPGARLYHTGDQARYLPSGILEFLGRTDQQIKLRGYRIELGEIEAALAHHPTVRQAVVALHVEDNLDPRLVAYLVPREESAPAHNGSPALTIETLRSFLADQLPEYMLPSTLVYLPALPLTPNDKVDRKALPAPNPFAADQQDAPETPRTPTAELLAGIWSHILRIENIQLHDNFFAVGGHSLLATQMAARVRDLFGIDLPLRAIFESPTLSALAESIDLTRQNRQPLTAPAHALRSPITPEEHLPVSFAQQRLWFLDQFQPGSAFYNIPLVLRITGKLHLDALQRGFTHIVHRHQALRATFADHQGQPLQVIHPPFSVPLPLIDLQALADPTLTHSLNASQEQLVSHLAQTAAQTPFNLSQGPLFNLFLLRLNSSTHILLLTIHHIISDGWSLDVLLHELHSLYTAFISGHAASLPPLPIQYTDYALQQRQLLQGVVLEQQLSYWKKQLANAPSVLAMPTDHPRPPVQTYQGAHYPLQFSSSLSSELTLLSRAQGVTLFMTLLAAFQTLLFRYTGQPDILVGAPIAGRASVAVERLIGFFVNTLVMRGDLTGDPRFTVLLKRVREVALDAYLYQDVPFEKLVEELQPQRNTSYSPLFQVMLILQNTPAQSLHLADLTLTPLNTAWVTAKFDLTLALWQENGQLLGYLEYNTDLFEPPTIERLAGYFHTLLAGIVSDPTQRLSQLPLLTAADRQQLLNAWNATQANFPLHHTIHALFEEQALRAPDSVAVISGASCLTYCELNRRANLLAHHLRALAIGRGSLVALCIDRSLPLLVGLLAILKSGAAYVPFDPSYPQERLAFMLADSQTSLVLTQQRLLDTLPSLATSARVVLLDSHWHAIARQPEHNLPHNLSGEDLAYIIYTSGSTGQPKGVLATHRATLNRLHWMWQRFPFTSSERACQKTSLSFVDSVWEIFGPLLRGISAVILPDQVVKDPPLLIHTLAEQSVTRIVLVPSLLHAVLDTALDLAQRLPRLHYWISSGETLPAELAHRLLNQVPAVVLLNLYGSSEVAADATYAQVTPGQSLSSVPIGRPIANTQVYLLDAQLQQVPIGVPGAIYIGGAGLALGYLNRPDLTAQRFLPDPFSALPGARLYYTGDLARYLPDGNLIFLGRTDRQVKLRGYRIEVQEIEAALAQHPAVRQAAVALRGDTTSDKRLVAYVVPVPELSTTRDSEQPLSLSSLHAFLQSKLPAYMLPSAVVLLSSLPLTPNGKIDWQALPSPQQATADTRDTPETALASRPPTTVEAVLIDIWASVLERDRIGVFDNFFELGGHSLLATQVIARVRALFQIDLSVLALFESPTVAEFAGSLIADEPAPGQILAMANVRLKLKNMSPQEARQRLNQRRHSSW